MFLKGTVKASCFMISSLVAEVFCYKKSLLHDQCLQQGSCNWLHPCVGLFSARNCYRDGIYNAYLQANNSILSAKCHSLWNSVKVVDKYITERFMLFFYRTG